jgi:peptidoglycan/LPS O-acetylase OafA/YrhL
VDAPVKAGTHEAFRPDIEGLRGIAVLLVILFHGGLVGVPGGFIGVDVFFVISGFLITGLLLRERERSGGIRLRAFYARRVRRLLPAGMLVLCVTLLASFIILSPVDRPGAAIDAAATAVSIGNIRFALAAGDYFASVSSPTPFLHFWSLGVEEQFYIVWPAILLVAARSRAPRKAIGVVLAVVFGASLAASAVVTELAVNWAFYSLPTRAWQLATGGLLAVAAVPLSQIPRWIAAALAWVGLATLAVTAVALDGSLPYPGLVAILPTLGAALLINAGMAVRGPGMVLASSPLRFLGRISYSLYLWHWPLFVLPVVALEAQPPLLIRLVLALTAVGVAWLSWRFVEEPFRAGFPVLARYPGRTVLAGGTAILLVVATAGSLAFAAERDLGVPPVDDSATVADRGPAALETWPPLDTWPPAITEEPDASAPTAEPSRTEAPATVAPTAEPTAVTYVKLPANVRPSLGEARLDEERLRGDGCLAFEGARVPRTCVYGDPQGTFTVALVGDSHAAQWFPAIEQIALARHWRILTFVKVACPFIDMRVNNIALKREYTECEAYRTATIARLAQVQPDLTLVSLSRFAIHPTLAGDRDLDRQGAAYGRVLAQIPGLVAAIVDTPEAGRDIPSCLSRHVADVRACAIKPSVAYSGNLGALEKTAATASGAGLIDLTSRVCRADPCAAVVDGMIVYRDSRHLTATFAASLAHDLDGAIGTLIETRAAPRRR